MITSSIGTQIIQIPTSWHDVPFERFINWMDCETALEQVSCLLDVSKDQLERLNSESLASIMLATSFMSELPDAYVAEENKMDIGKESYGKVEVAKAHLIAAEKPFKAMIPILKVYTDVDYSKLPTTISYPLAAFFLNSYHDFLKSTSD
jgi:hypothetical protein